MFCDFGLLHPDFKVGLDSFATLRASLTLAVAAAAPSQSPSSLHASYASAFVNFLDFATDMSCSPILAQCLVVCVVL